MKTQINQLLLAVLVLCALSGCQKKLNEPGIDPINGNGTISVNVDGSAWSGAYCIGAAGGTSTKVSVFIDGKASEKSAVGDDRIIIALDSYVGKGEYKITGKAFGSVNLTYKGAEYIYDLGTGTEPVIKITESTAAGSVINPGKIIGEFSGTLTNKKTGKSVTLTNGKFTCIRIL